MNTEDESTAFITAQTKVQEALQALVEVWGPRTCIHGDWADCNDCEYDQTNPQKDAILTEFILVANWTSMTTGSVDMTFITPPRQLTTHTNGLLHTMLYE